MQLSGCHVYEAARNKHRCTAHPVDPGTGSSAASSAYWIYLKRLEIKAQRLPSLQDCRKTFLHTALPVDPGTGSSAASSAYWVSLKKLKTKAQCLQPQAMKPTRLPRTHPCTGRHVDPGTGSRAALSAYWISLKH